jgi:hypothetical protein
MLLTLGAVFFVGAIVLYILAPILQQRDAPLVRTADEPTEAEAEKRIALLALRDVEYDFAMGKLDETDYSSLRGDLSARALQAIQAEEEERSEAAPARELFAIEEEIEQIRLRLRAGIACPKCAVSNEEGSRFCAACGERLGHEPAVAGESPS